MLEVAIKRPLNNEIPRIKPGTKLKKLVSAQRASTQHPAIAGGSWRLQAKNPAWVGLITKGKKGQEPTETTSGTRPSPGCKCKTYKTYWGCPPKKMTNLCWSTFPTSELEWCDNMRACVLPCEETEGLGKETFNLNYFFFRVHRMMIESHEIVYEIIPVFDVTSWGLCRRLPHACQSTMPRACSHRRPEPGGERSRQHSWARLVFLRCL